MQEVEMGEHISNDRPRPVHQQLRRRRHLQILQKGYSGDIKKEKYHPHQPDQDEKPYINIYELCQYISCPERILQISKNTFHCLHLSFSSSEP